MPKHEIAVIILAAGKSTRMKSAVPKVLHELCGRPMLSYVTDLAKAVRARRTIVVLGHQAEAVRPIVPAGVEVVLQRLQKGTAHAVRQALPRLRSFSGTVLILYGDTPLLQAETVRRLVRKHRDSGAAATILTAKLQKPAGYGRIVRDAYQSISEIVEEKDADDFQKTIDEINTGFVCFQKAALQKVLSAVKTNNRKGEFYLTDCIRLLARQGKTIAGMDIGDVNEALGINSRLELAQAAAIIQRRINERHMKAGVTIVDPATAWIAWGARIGADTVIYPFTFIEKGVSIKGRCSVGPFARLREGTRLEQEVVIGNFLEIVRSRISPQSLAKHFGYIGDSRIGRRVNIGAGTVTANFDGKAKNETIIRDGAFIGSDSVLVAPVFVGRGAVTGAGAVLPRRTRVRAGETVVGVPARRLQKD